MTRDKRHLFVYRDSMNGQGILAETQGTVDGPEIVVPWGFYYEWTPLDIAVVIDYTAHRWDAWVEAAVTGDRSLIDGPRTRMYKVRDRKNFELGLKKDRFTVHFAPKDQLPATIVGVPLTLVRQVLDLQRSIDDETTVV